MDSSSRSASVIVVDTSPEDALGRMLVRALGAGVRIQSDLPGPGVDPSVRLAVGVCPVGDDDRLDTFARWAWAAGIPALEVGLGSDAALIGPVALPGRAGCGHCARQRAIAASAVDRRSTADRFLEPALPDLTVIVGRALAREARAVLQHGPESSRLVDHALVVDARTRESSLHRVIPLSRCPVCGGAAERRRSDSEAPWLSPDDPPEVVLGALAGWVDPRTGVISGLVVERPADTGVDLPIVATAAPPRVVADDGSLRRLPLGWGKGLTLSGAILSAVGEAIERYSASLPDPARIVWERPDDLDGDRLDPRVFALYTDAQYAREGFPYARFDPTVRHPWVRGRWLSGGSPVWVPAVLAFLSLRLWPEHLICQGTSNGLAASTDVPDAGLRATLELVERDALLASWLTGRPGHPVRIDDTLDPRLGRVIENVEALGPAVEIYVLPTSAVGTTVLCLALGDGARWPAVTIGLGADLDPGLAVHQAILELGQTGPFLSRMMRSGALPTPGEPGEVRDMLHHAAYYFPSERATAFDRVRGRGEPIALGDLRERNPERSLASCASALDAAGIRVALVDVTAPDVATGPFRVVRAISPDLQPIWYGYGMDRPPVARIRAGGLAPEIPPISPIW